MELTGQIVRYRKKQSPVFLVQHADSYLWARGPFPFFGDPVGVTCTLHGDWEMDVQDGRMFRFQRCEIPHIDQIVMTLTQIPGIGRTLARRVVDHFGPDGVESVLRGDVTGLLAVPGIKKRKLSQIMEFWERSRILQELAQELVPACLTHHDLERLYALHDKNLPERVRNHPYRLIPDIPFHTADRIAQTYGVVDETARVHGAAIWHLHASLVRGITLVTPEEAYKQVSLLTGLSRDRLDPIWDLLATRRVRLYMGQWFVLSRVYDQCARILDVISNRPSHDLPLCSERKTRTYIVKKQSEMGLVFSPEQQDAIRAIASGERTLVICGYAGTGKTTVAKAILDLLAERVPRDEIVCLALSGVAAERLRKTTGHQARTIHSFLGLRDPADKPVPSTHRVVLVDEASMIGNELFAYLFECIRRDASLIVMGDAAQLPPIDHGRLFEVMLDAGPYPVVRMEHVFRQEEGILQVAHAIRNGTMPHFGGPCVCVETPPTGVLMAIRKTVMSALDTFGPQDIQILTPCRDGVFGAENLNRVLQDVLNPIEGVVIGDRQLRKGDRVIHLQNRDMDTSAGCRRVFNGMIGYVSGIDAEARTVTVAYDEFDVPYDTALYGELFDLAYAMTVHKAQGNEFPCVIIPLVQEHARMYTRNLIYTAVTRASRQLHFIGDPRLVAQAVDTRPIRHPDMISVALGCTHRRTTQGHLFA